jgi:hypothetical protein
MVVNYQDPDGPQHITRASQWDSRIDGDATLLRGRFRLQAAAVEDEAFVRAQQAQVLMSARLRRVPNS